ncbi:hypothetical protein COT97_02015 [Candidatus Falkowbacteria bacterium CG10_big_fil_rev_8_21_14_0_10_39_11]|uniref:Uncharacterized protein n=1 Tax=Candidatus Falkowbacteria bacterium CG10_big_fil_rev_8_21_14_0_10_39_11 TaxID=1974565 RepID=A0A2H0V574_9BACT|nr:MAG: hypothetical protein COT97_02015 [Candidatus Falkowbacteria bacterium CG10_big_fil_rev_8_21_14_0_10_39_11]
MDEQILSPEKKEEIKKDHRLIQTVMIAVFVTAVFVGLLVWLLAYVIFEPIVTEQQITIKNLESKINEYQENNTDRIQEEDGSLTDLKVDEIDSMMDEMMGTGDENERPIEQTVQYYNRDYEFAMTFPASWADFEVRESSNDYGGPVSIKTFYFGFPAQDDLFAVTVWSLEEWNKYVELNPERAPSMLVARNDIWGWVYTFEQGQYTVNDEMHDRFSEIAQIRQSFKADPGRNWPQ